MDDAHARVDRVDPERVFGLLGNETRLEIVSALGEHIDGSVSFSELRDQVGTRDSGQFNYHLQQLVGTFVTRDDDGYALTLAGRNLVGALLAGTYTASVSFDRIDLEDRCGLCGGAMAVTVEDDHVHLGCLDCDTMNVFEFPAGTLEDFSREELPDALNRWLWRLLAELVAGFCANCHGRLDGAVTSSDVNPDGMAIDYSCRRCGSTSTTSLTAPLLFHPAGVSLFYEHGVDVTKESSWTLLRHTESDVEWVDDDEFVARARLTLDGDELVAMYREDASMVVE